jgi:hypothetical protein
MRKKILIFGYGKWAKKIIRFLKKKKTFTEIYIKTSKRFFKIYPEKRKFILKNFDNQISKIKYFHICAPTSKHYEIIELNNFRKVKLIIEKPLINKNNELSKIKPFFKYNKIIVNYIDLYNPLLQSIKKKINTITSLNIEFGSKSLFKKKDESIDEWLDHPLAILLFLFKKFPDFKIIHYRNKKIKRQYIDMLHLQYYFENKIINVKLNMKFPVLERLITIKKKNLITKINLRKKIKNKNQKIKIDNDNSLNLLYNDFEKSKISYFQNFNFHKEIYEEKKRIKKRLQDKKNISKHS